MSQLMTRRERPTKSMIARGPLWALAKRPKARAAKAVGSYAIGSFALGALATGAVAVGTFAIGRLAVGRLALREGRIKRLRIDHLEVGEYHLLHHEPDVATTDNGRTVTEKEPALRS